LNRGAFVSSFLLCFALSIFFVSTVTPLAPTIEALVNIKPDNLNLESNTKWVSACIEALACDGTFPDLQDINVSTISLYRDHCDFVTEVHHSKVLGNKVVVWFNASHVIDYIRELLYYMGIGLPPPTEKLGIELVVAGQLFDGRQFQGSDVIHIFSS